MNKTSSKIGFDRFIHLDWASTALRVRAGDANIEDLIEILNLSHTGQEAKKKTKTVLNRLWLEPRHDLVDFADRGVQIYRSIPNTLPSTLTWGMALANYPFFGKVAEIVGRLTALQGDCTTAEVHRRMAEIYGEREGTRRMTNMVLQSQANWSALERIDNGKRIVRKKLIDLNGSPVSTWLVEACLRNSIQAIPLVNIEKSPILYPFDFGVSLAYLLSKEKIFEMRTDGAGNQLISLSNLYSSKSFCLRRLDQQ